MPTPLYCSWCGKSQHEVRKIIAGPTVFVCDECVEAGMVPLGDDFADGVDYPPAHPNCICDVVPVLKDEESP